MEINIGNIRKRKGIQQWTCYIWYMKTIAERPNGSIETKQELYIHGNSKQEVQNKVDHQVKLINEEHGTEKI